MIKSASAVPNRMAYEAAKTNPAGGRHEAQSPPSLDSARVLIEASLDPMVTISMEGRITDANQAVVEATGVERSKIIGSDFSIYFTDPARAIAAYQEAFAKGSIKDFELSLRRVTGAVIDVVCNATVYRDAKGNPAGLFAAARDVTAQKQASRYARSLIEASPDPLVTISPEGKITDVNEATIKVTGVGRDRLIGTDFSDYFTEPEKAREGYRAVFAKGLVTDYPLTIRHTGGKLTDVLYNASVYKSADGKVLGIFAAARDVTERKRAEVELHKYRTHLEEMVAARTSDLAAANVKLDFANKEMEAFAYSVSHDLRAPLRAIDGFSHILLEDYADKLDAEGRRLLHVVRDSTVKMGRMIDDILSFSRVGRTEMASDRVDMEALVGRTIKDLETVVAGRTVNFKIGKLAPARGDEPMLQRVWTNLLDNAVKYTGKITEAEISVGSEPGASETIYFVHDNGAGFDMQYVGRLFGAFQRLHGDEFPGTGIGLAVVKRIVTRHGGRVWAEGKLNEGATFYFTLPRQEGQ